MSSLTTIENHKIITTEQNKSHFMREKNGSQENENIYDSISLPGNPGNAISPGHPEGN